MEIEQANLVYGKKAYSKIAAYNQRWKRSLFQGGFAFLVCLTCLFYLRIFDAERMSDGIPNIFGLFGEGILLRFTNAANWLIPILSTLAMGIAGIVIAATISLWVLSWALPEQL